MESDLRSDICDYSDAYNVVKGTIDLLAAAANENDKAQKNNAFKNQHANCKIFKIRRYLSKGITKKSKN